MTINFMPVHDVIRTQKINQVAFNGINKNWNFMPT